MKNLEMYGVQEMSPVEIKQTAGGGIIEGLFWMAIDWAIGYADWSIFQKTGRPLDPIPTYDHCVCDNA